MLSTQPEGSEPHGGDNVRLYVWNRVTGKVSRMGAAIIMTQTRYGGGLNKLDLRGGADGGTIPHTCGQSENAPILWLDNTRLLALTLPSGRVSGLIDQYSRSYRAYAEDAKRLRDGRLSTAHAVGSGDALTVQDPADSSAIIRTVDTSTGKVWTVATVPTYPFRGAISLTVSPNGRRLALLATLGSLQPLAHKAFPNASDDNWTVERRLGFIDLLPNSSVRWVPLVPQARYPLELYDWSPDSSQVAFRARADRFSGEARLFTASTGKEDPRQVSAMSVAADHVRSSAMIEAPVLWADQRHLVARLRSAQSRTQRDWWLLNINGAATDLTHGAEAQPAGFRRDANGRLVGVRMGELVQVDTKRRVLVSIGKVPAQADIAWPRDPNLRADILTVSTTDGRGVSGYQQIDSATGKAIDDLRTLPGELLDADYDAGRLLARDSGNFGLFLRQTSKNSSDVHDLLALDTGLATIDWGRTRLIEYQDAKGTPLKAAVILPPNYQAGKRYPTLVWVYQGYRVSGLEGDYFLDPFMPGIYNLQLYAARGYVILIPSMPLPPIAQRGRSYDQISALVSPALDQLIALGIADPARLGVFGQSRGGYTVEALVTQTDRFKAAVAMAGISDLATFYRIFDPTAYGFSGIEHEKSDNWAEVDQFGLKQPPVDDPVSYPEISPLSYVGKVTTPLLMIHGTADIRGSTAEDEQFFYSLYGQGKTARLVRYGGESHSLAQSPANVRNIFSETIAWFDRYVKADPFHNPN